MSFGKYARRVRDESLPRAYRYRALRCAVGHYHPLGFHATWAYVTTLAVPSHDIRRDVPALLRALDVLEASRTIWLAEMETFAANRRAEKSAGRRSPRSAEKTALAMPRWPGRPSRLGLIAAVANRHRWFRQLPFPDESLSDGQAGDLAALHSVLDTVAVAYLAQPGPLSRTAREAIIAIDWSVSSGLNSSVLPWRQFAALLEYAAIWSVPSQTWS
ncbi:hypothetical protein [Actinomadura rudentiformis]|uniref:Uncharacterized protein n=1 Tax=Actinomadura rudentiformis TaxID=359158 RepID=A0A6H9Z1P2_9ACTN|nr:hypothetical protein [Actinomadura rudentiformis]KAB2350703.1 hypothetical protein F8566_06865 [Actinomadura rudentiformis]